MLSKIKFIILGAILSVIGISILALIVAFFLSLSHTVYHLPIGPIYDVPN